MLLTRRSVLARLLLCVFLLSAAFLTADGQTTPPAGAKTALRAVTCSRSGLLRVQDEDKRRKLFRDRKSGLCGV